MSTCCAATLSGGFSTVGVGAGSGAALGAGAAGAAALGAAAVSGAGSVFSQPTRTPVATSIACSFRLMATSTRRLAHWSQSACIHDVDRTALQKGAHVFGCGLEQALARRTRGP